MNKERKEEIRILIRGVIDKIIGAQESSSQIFSLSSLIEEAGPEVSRSILVDHFLLWAEKYEECGGEIKTGEIDTSHAISQIKALLFFVVEAFSSGFYEVVDIEIEVPEEEFVITVNKTAKTFREKEEKQKRIDEIKEKINSIMD